MKFYQTLFFNLIIWIFSALALILGGTFYTIHEDVHQAYKKFAEDKFHESFLQIETKLREEAIISGPQFNSLSIEAAKLWVQDTFNKFFSDSNKNNLEAILVFRLAREPFWNGEAWIFERQIKLFETVEVSYQQVLRFDHFETIRLRGQHLIILFLTFIGLLGFLLMIFLTQRLTKPLSILQKASLRVAEGDFKFTLPVVRDDEIGLLTESFNQMVKDLGLKSKYRELLDQLTDEAVAKKLLEGEMSLTGEKRMVTVLFCDVRGFTHLSEILPPEELIQLLNEHMGTLSEIAHQFYGVVDKFIGDAIMVIFGSPQRYENDAQNAIQAASLMMKKRLEMNARSQFSLEIGIGLATGVAVAGCLGSKERLNYTVIGEVVNRASRICSKAAPGEVLFDQATKEKIDGSFSVKSLGELQLKGIEKPIHIFGLL